MALVRDQCLVPTKDAPELGYIRESTDRQYVPDVYYKVRCVLGMCMCAHMRTHAYIVGLSIVKLLLLLIF